MNRPSTMTFGGLSAPGQGSSRLQDNFANSVIYIGGFDMTEIVHVVHGHSLPGSKEIVPGIHAGGEVAAIEAVERGELSPREFRFFAGCKVWEPGELQAEVARGAWVPAACSRPLVLKPCLGLPTPLWREVMELMGGDFGEEARRAYGIGGG
uniref:Transcriptional regulator n=2 Tax=Tetraselmis sp. GSL018 TaxID=582737 RepID=A0A061RL08_9CHLO